MPTGFVIFKSTEDFDFEEGISTVVVAVALTSEAATAELSRQAEAAYMDSSLRHCQVKVRGPYSISVKGVADFYAEEVPLVS